jgi:hypothetical protein
MNNSAPEASRQKLQDIAAEWGEHLCAAWYAISTTHAQETARPERSE